jgi:hypothetical protein
MRVPGAALIEEGVRTYFSQPAILRTYLLVPCAVGLALLLVWPRAPLASLLRVGPSPNPFVVASVSLLVFALYLSARYGSEDYSPGTLVQLREYVEFTPVSLVEVALGKAAFAAAHTLFLLLLGAPFLFAAMAAGGMTEAQVLVVLAVTGAACLAARMFGLLVLTLVRSGPLLRDVILLPAITLCLVLTLLFLPQANPIDAVVGAAIGPRPGSGRMAPSLISIVISLGAALLLGAAAMVSLRAMRRSHE